MKIGAEVTSPYASPSGPNHAMNFQDETLGSVAEMFPVRKKAFDFRVRGSSFLILPFSLDAV